MNNMYLKKMTVINKLLDLCIGQIMEAGLIVREAIQWGKVASPKYRILKQINILVLFCFVFFFRPSLRCVPSFDEYQGSEDFPLPEPHHKAFTEAMHPTDLQ